METDPASPSSRPSPRELTSLSAILTSLSEIESQEANLGITLSNLLANQEPIISSLTRLQSIAPHVDELLLDAHLLSEKVGMTAQTAQRVGGRVRALDEEMRRVKEANDRVNAVLDLKVSLLLPSHPKHRLRSTQVVISRASCLHGCSRLGSRQPALRSCYGNPEEYHFRTFC